MILGRVLALAACGTLLAAVPAKANAQSAAASDNARPTETPTTANGQSARSDEYAAIRRERFRDAPGVTPIDEPVRPTADTPDREIFVSGFYRTRGDLGFNWDLNRGPTPSSGQPIWPVAYVDDGRSRLLTNLDMRLRVDAEARIGYGVSIVGRLHVLDNLRFGSTPEGAFSGGTLNQVSPSNPVEVRQLYARVLLPFGILFAGRMGALVDWGTGFFVNSGNGLEDDFGDVGDRVMFTTSLGGLLWSALYEVSAGGPGTNSLRPDIQPALDLDPRDDVRTAAFTVAMYDTPMTRRRKLAARRTSVNFGLIAAYRAQDYDLRAGATPSSVNAIRRDLQAFDADLWIRADIGDVTLEAELGYAYTHIGNPSVDPNIVINVPLTGNPFGALARVDWRASPRIFARVEAGFASGDSAPGFGARNIPNPARPGDLDGVQFDYTRSPIDSTADNFRFHPNYRVDLILFRRLIGTVTDAAYLRPMVRVRLLPMLTVEAALIGSMAVRANSTPSGQRPLGVEGDLALLYEQEHGFFARLDYGLLVPLAGFRNEVLNVDPSPAHTLHLLLAYRF